MHRERAGEQDRLLWSSCLVAVLIAICVSILSYPEWKKGFSSFRSDLEIVAASRGDGQFVDVSWDAGTSTKTLRVPVQHVEATQEWQIEFTYLGAKDRRSQATEVWILQIAAPNVLDWSLVPKAPGWEFRPHALGSDFFGQVAYTGPPNTRKLTLRGGTLSVQLLRHDRGGLLRLAVNGDQQEINLYSPTPEIATFTWQPTLPAARLSPPQRLHARVEGDRPLRSARVSAEPEGRVEINSVRLAGEQLAENSPGEYPVASLDWSGSARAAVASVLSFFLISATLALVTIVWRRQELVNPLLPRITAPLAAITISLFWTAVFFPCHMSPDSFTEWQQAVSGEYHNWHPIGMALVMRGVHLALGSRSMELQLAAVAFLQGSLFWLIIFKALTVIPVSLRKKIVLCVLAAIYYPLWVYTITLWKDVWFAICFLGLLLCARPVQLEGYSGWRRWAAMVALLTCALLNRQTAAVSFLALAAASLPFVWANRGLVPALRTLALSLSVLFCAAALQTTLYRVLHVKDDGQLSNLVAAYEVVGVVRFSNEPVSSFQNLATYRIAGGANFEQAVKEYLCGGPFDYLLYFPGSPFDMLSLLQDRSAIQDLPRLALTSPGAYLHHRACAVACLLDLSGRGVYYPYHSEVQVNTFGVREQSLLPNIRGLVLKFLDHASSYPKWLPLQLPFRHWLVLAASLAAAALSLFGAIFRRLESSWRMMPAYFSAGGCAILLPLLVVTPAGDWRYLMPANACWLIGILCAVVLGFNRSNPKHPISTQSP